MPPNKKEIEELAAECVAKMRGEHVEPTKTQMSRGDKKYLSHLALLIAICACDLTKPEDKRMAMQKLGELTSGFTGREIHAVISGAVS